MDYGSLSHSCLIVLLEQNLLHSPAQYPELSDELGVKKEVDAPTYAERQNRSFVGIRTEVWVRHVEAHFKNQRSSKREQNAAGEDHQEHRQMETFFGKVSYFADSVLVEAVDRERHGES